MVIPAFMSLSTQCEVNSTREETCETTIATIPKDFVSLKRCLIKKE